MSVCKLTDDERKYLVADLDLVAEYADALTTYTKQRYHGLALEYHMFALQEKISEIVPYRCFMGSGLENMYGKAYAAATALYENRNFDWHITHITSIASRLMDLARSEGYEGRCPLQDYPKDKVEEAV